MTTHGWPVWRAGDAVPATRTAVSVDAPTGPKASSPTVAVCQMFRMTLFAAPGIAPAAKSGAAGGAAGGGAGHWPCCLGRCTARVVGAVARIHGTCRVPGHPDGGFPGCNDRPAAASGDPAHHRPGGTTGPARTGRRHEVTGSRGFIAEPAAAPAPHAPVPTTSGRRGSSAALHPEDVLAVIGMGALFCVGWPLILGWRGGQPLQLPVVIAHTC